MATLDDIVSAAAKVFRTKGYHAATVRDIAEEVGILKGSLYHHFASKEELLYLVVKEPIAQMFRTIAEIAAAEGGAAEKLTRAISAHLEAFDRHYPHLFVYLRERESVRGWASSFSVHCRRSSKMGRLSLATPPSSPI